MEVYRRITERVRGALWAHHRRLMPERQFHRILAYVYNNKYEHQLRFDQMEVVGSEWGGKVEVVTTPAGFLKRVRVNPAVEDLTQHQRDQLILSAYHDACTQGRALMEQAEMNIYKQFLKDLKPIILGIRDNPEFYTVSPSSTESIGATLRSQGTVPELTHRTIPAARAHQPTDEVRARHEWEQQWLQSPEGQDWSRSLRAKEYFANHGPQYRPRGAPGAKRRALPFEILAPYTPMDEGRLLKKNWMAYLDNKHVAESLWTRTAVADREKKLRQLQERGQAWHRPVHHDATDRCYGAGGDASRERESLPGTTASSSPALAYILEPEEEHQLPQAGEDGVRMGSDSDVEEISVTRGPPPEAATDLSAIAPPLLDDASVTATMLSMETTAESTNNNNEEEEAAAAATTTPTLPSSHDNEGTQHQQQQLSPLRSSSGSGARFRREETFNHLSPPVKPPTSVSPTAGATPETIERGDSMSDELLARRSDKDGTPASVVRHMVLPDDPQHSRSSRERSDRCGGASAANPHQNGSESSISGRSSPGYASPATAGREAVPFRSSAARGLSFLDNLLDSSEDDEATPRAADDSSGARPPSLAPDPSSSLSPKATLAYSRAGAGQTASDPHEIATSRPRTAGRTEGSPSPPARDDISLRGGAARGGSSATSGLGQVPKSKESSTSRPGEKKSDDAVQTGRARVEALLESCKRRRLQAGEDSRSVLREPDASALKGKQSPAKRSSPLHEASQQPPPKTRPAAAPPPPPRLTKGTQWLPSPRAAAPAAPSSLDRVLALRPHAVELSLPQHHTKVYATLGSEPESTDGACLSGQFVRGSRPDAVWTARCGERQSPRSLAEAESSPRDTSRLAAALVRGQLSPAQRTLLSMSMTSWSSRNTSLLVDVSRERNRAPRTTTTTSHVTQRRCRDRPAPTPHHHRQRDGDRANSPSRPALRTASNTIPTRCATTSPSLSSPPRWSRGGSPAGRFTSPRATAAGTGHSFSSSSPPVPGQTSRSPCRGEAGERKPRAQVRRQRTPSAIVLANTPAAKPQQTMRGPVKMESSASVNSLLTRYGSGERRREEAAHKQGKEGAPSQRYDQTGRTPPPPRQRTGVIRRRATTTEPTASSLALPERRTASLSRKTPVPPPPQEQQKQQQQAPNTSAGAIPRGLSRDGNAARPREDVASETSAALAERKSLSSDRARSRTRPPAAAGVPDPATTIATTAAASLPRAGPSGKPTPPLAEADDVPTRWRRRPHSLMVFTATEASLRRAKAALAAAVTATAHQTRADTAAPMASSSSPLKTDGAARGLPSHEELGLAGVPV